jgi:hypothetical protein
MRTDAATTGYRPATLFRFAAQNAAGVPVRIVIEVAIVPENVSR